ncbi:MAG: gephyrin-like molybdotransferase Glp [Pseudomonadota bacterium]
MISVDAALEALFKLVSPLPTEAVALKDAAGRVLAEEATATRAQPPFDASAMDGYACRAADAHAGARLKVIGEAAAGARFAGHVSSGEAVRIFTGAPLPSGADHVEIQENADRDGDTITLTDPAAPGRWVRPAGGDFEVGAKLSAPRRLGPADIALLAAMNTPAPRVTRRPDVAIISTGDELVMPGETPRDDQIIASNAVALHALLAGAGALPRMLPIARDTEESLSSVFRFARGADLIVTIGGASVGDHDLVRGVATEAGMAPSFYRVAMRPGKPLMAGRLGATPILGLPGNPVSSLVCGHIFLLPMLRVMLGLPAALAPRVTARLAHDLPAGGPREHYARARVARGEVHIFDRQDSSLLTVFAEANALAVIPPDAPARPRGAEIELVLLDTNSEHP